MVRSYKPKGSKSKFLDKDMRNALQDLSENKGSIRKIVAAYGIPNSTLHAHYRGISKKRYGGYPTALTYQEEQEIVHSCIALQEMGFPLDKASLTSLVADYIRESGRDNPFCEGVPGPDWFAGFMRRLQYTLSRRKPQHLSRKRAKALTKEKVEKWMEFVETIFHEAGLFKLSTKQLGLRL